MNGGRRVGKEEQEEMGWEQWEVTEGMARLPVIWLCAGGDRRSDLEGRWSGRDQNGMCIQLGGRMQGHAGRAGAGAGGGGCIRGGRGMGAEEWTTESGWLRRCNVYGEESVECVGGGG